MNPDLSPPTFADAVKRLWHNEHFQAIYTELIARREHAMAALGNYESDTVLRKTAAEVSVLTDLLDDLSANAEQIGKV